MNIAIFTELYFPHVGGQEVRFQEIAELLVKRGHRVNVFCVNNVPGCPPQESINGVEVKRYPVAESYKDPRFKVFRRKPSVMLRYAWWTRKQASQDFDVYIYNQWPLLHVALAPRSVRRKSICDWCETRSGRLFGMIQKSLPRLTAKNMAVSMAVKQLLESVSGMPFTYIPSGITASRYKGLRRKERSGLLYVGRITEHKNLPLLVAAYGELRRSGYYGPLTIAGAGTALESLKTLVQTDEFSEEIRLLGFVSEDQKIELLSEAEVLVIPSKREGFPRVVAEAMASGLPTVTADFTDNGTKDVVLHYRSGVVTKGDPASLAAGIHDALSDWDRLSEAGLAARQSLEWEVIVDDLLKLATYKEKGVVHAY